MVALIWAGVAATMAGLAGIVWCIVAVRRARAEGLDDATLRARLARIVAVNLGALGMSALGLGMVVAGILLN
jgi:hypothetical protein